MNADNFSFSLKGTNQQLTFLPHYKQHTNRYGIYFRLADKNTEIPKSESDIDVVFSDEFTNKMNNLLTDVIK